MELMRTGDQWDRGLLRPSRGYKSASTVAVHYPGRRHGLLLLNESNAPLSQRQAYAEVLAHELAHMWFGNLVTMAWWEDLWVNEAFATWRAYKVTDLYAPAWGIDTTMLVSTHEAAVSDHVGGQDGGEPAFHVPSPSRGGV